MTETRNVPIRKIIIFALTYCLIFAIRFFQHLYTVEVRSAMTLMLYTVLFIAGIFLFRQHLADSWQLLKKSISRSLLLLIGFYFIFILFSVLAYYLLPIGDATNDQNVYQIARAFPTILILAILGIMGPIVEEFVYRHLLIYRLSSRIPVWGCVLLSSILFGLLHMHSFSDLTNIVPYLTISLILGTLYVVSKYNLLVPIIFHTFNNLSALIPLVLYT